MTSNMTRVQYPVRPPWWARLFADLGVIPKGTRVTSKKGTWELSYLRYSDPWERIA